MNHSEKTSPWTPLGHRSFRVIWIAGFVSNVGTWMQNVGATWLMTSLTDSVLLVALVQTAAALPSLLLALPAGAVADLVDRRRILLAAQCWMLLVSVALSTATLTGRVGPWMLLALTFSFGCAVAFGTPAQQATTSDVVPQPLVPRAVALSGISFNGARAVGPLLAGGLIAWAGSGAVFVVNVLSFALVIGLLLRWKNPPRAPRLREGLLAGMAAGMRYVRHAPVMHGLLRRSSLFVGASSALWALLPVVARDTMGLGSAGYGLMLAALGVGSITGAALLPRLRQRLGTDRMVTMAAAGFAGAMVLLAVHAPPAVTGAALVLAGVAWIAVNATINSAVHTSVAHWVRGRVLAIHLLAFQGCMAAGAVLWGSVATLAGVSQALLLAGAMVVVGVIVLRRQPVVVADGSGLAPSLPLALRLDPPVSAVGAGWLLVRVRYRPRPDGLPAFDAGLARLGRARARNGARRWRRMPRCGSHGAVVESFAVRAGPHWQQFIERHVLGDRQLEQALQHLLVGAGSPEVRVRLVREAAPLRRE